MPRASRSGPRARAVDHDYQAGPGRGPPGAGGRRGRPPLGARPRRCTVARRPACACGGRVGDRCAAMTPPLLDTHAWIWWVDQDRRLGAKAIAALDHLPRDERPWLCDISLWEVATLVERERLSLDVPLREWLDAAAHPRSVRLVSITPPIAAAVAALPT